MPRKHSNIHRRRRIAGKGFAADALKRLVMEALPAVAKLAEGPAKELGEAVADKIRSLRGKGMEGGNARLSGERSSGGSAFLSGMPPSLEKKRRIALKQL